MINVFIDIPDGHILDKKQIEYCFRVIFKIVGVPWNFISKENLRNDIDIDISYSTDRSVKSKIIIIPFFCSGIIAEVKPEGIREYKNIPFILFNGNNDFLPITKDQKIVFNNDIIFTIYYLLTGKYEKNLIRDKKNRIEFLNDNIFSRGNILVKPLVNLYSGLIKKYLAVTDTIPAWPDNKKYAVALSHDVDYPEMIKWVECLRYALKYKHRAKLKKIFDILSGKESFFLFEEWMKLEEKYNLKSAFYFSGLKRGSLLKYLLVAPDTFYDINKQDYRSVMRSILQNGFEVGLHTSYKAYKNIEYIEAEKRGLENVLEKSICGNRHHYWNFNSENPVETMNFLYDSGITYDSSIAFSKNYGFRYSICSPFKFYDEKKSQECMIVEIPVTAMDDHFFGYNLNKENPEKIVNELLNVVRENKGIFVVDFHLRVMNKTFFPKWGRLYKYILERIKDENDFYCDTPENIARHCLNRDRMLEELSA